ncbi:MAG: hypothetical protein EBZ53_06835, partial [Verrucomicrobia bacterium]|nr:hypothetical protein [Verrucomicrobiota bacterium]
MTLGGSPTGSVLSKDVGTTKTVTVTGYSLSGTASGNYTVTQPTELTADITAQALSVTAPTIASKTYDGTTTAGAVTVGTLTGFVGTETVTATGAAAAYSSANADTYNNVTITYTLANGTNGGLASNYSLANGAATGQITKASQTITFGALPSKLVGDAPFALSATSNSGLTVSYTSSNTGVATVAGNTVTIVGKGTTTITASQAGDSNYDAASSVPQTLSVTVPPSLTEVYVPQYIQGGLSTNTKRIPYAYRVTLSNLTANATYRYYNQAVIDSDSATSAGAGNVIFVSATGSFVRTSSPSLLTAGGYGTFTTDANGSYTGWFMTEPTGNATRFATAGTQIKMRIILNDGNNGTTAATYLTTTSYVTVKAIGTTAASATAIRGTSSADAKNFVLLYDNTSGTGRPIAGTVVEGDGVDNSTGNSFASFYATSVNEVSGAWGTLIPNTLPNGVLRIENRAKADGSLIAYSTDSDGTWPSGVNTVNPSGGDTTVLVIASSDAPLVPQPAISYSGSLSTLSTTYGTASSSTQFSVSGANMTAGILVTPPSGFEVSTDNSAFSGTVTVGSSGTISSTTVYVRLAATASAGNKSGNISLTSSGAANVNVPTVASTVSQKALTIGAPTLTTTKEYDGTTTAAVTAGALSGVVGSDTVTASATAEYDTAGLGTSKT